MEDNKYYTPSIEEFHIGFEYEYKQDFLHYLDKTYNEWVKEKFTGYSDLDGLCEINNIERLLFQSDKNNQIRVKYLDKEDIESLGFKKLILNDVEVYAKNNWLILSYDLNDILDIKNQKNYITITKLHEDSNYYYEPSYFRGYIKNKSELIKILKMIEIYEN